MSDWPDVQSAHVFDDPRPASSTCEKEANREVGASLALVLDRLFCRRFLGLFSGSLGLPRDDATGPCIHLHLDHVS